jgi:rod shape-determining protein MreC
VFERRGARALLAALVVVALVLVTIDFRAGDEGPVAEARGGVTAVLRPVQDGIVTLLRPVTEAAGNVRDLFAVRAENQRLRGEVADLEVRRRSMTDLERENAELRELLELAATDLETVAARVVALAPSGFEWTMTIDVGSNHGVARNMPVVNGDGLVGRVIQATPSASRVLLAIDPSFSAAARSARTGEIGAVDGRGGEPMAMRPLDPAADLQVGDEIVTSAYQGGVFPSGIPIGTVTAVGEDTSPLVQEVQVSPFVDFTRIHHVLVVRSAPVEEVPPLSDLEDLEFEPPEGPPIIDRTPADEVPSDPETAPDTADDAEPADTGTDGTEGVDAEADDAEADDAEADDAEADETEEQALNVDRRVLALARRQVEGEGRVAGVVRG